MTAPDPELARLEGRNGAIWREYCEGRTQTWLAGKYGLAQSRISQIIDQVRASIPNVDRDEEIQRSLELLRELRAGALEIWHMAAAPVTAGKDGTVVYDPETHEVVRDHAGRLRALETALKTDQMIATRLGLDAASKMDLSVSRGEETAAKQLAEEAAARVFGEQGDDSADS